MFSIFIFATLHFYLTYFFFLILRKGQFRCRSGQCIDESLTWDGHSDCSDKTDEHAFICEEFK